jgi:MoaA/NifB/PqqE/SkfB family radical SAM enzyme
MEWRRQVMVTEGGAGRATDGARLVYDPVSNATERVQDLLAVAGSSACDVRSTALRYYFLAPGSVAPALNWELTYSCTWRCRHCFQPTRHVKAPAAGAAYAGEVDGRGLHDPVVSDERVEQVIELLRTLEAREISLTGGEVLLVEDLPAIVRRLREALPDLSIRVLLSGRDLPRRALDGGLLSALAETGACARLPLYGPTAAIHDWVTRTPGGFEDVGHFARLARDRGVRVHVGVQVLSATYPFLAATLRLAEELSGADLSLSTVIYPARQGDGQDHALTTAQLMHLLRTGPTAAAAIDHLTFEAGRCASGCEYPTIGPLGDVRTCDIGGDRVGYLGEPAAWLQRKLQSRPVRTAEECTTCTHADVCKQCPAFLKEGRCAGDYRARLAAASLVVAHRVNAARQRGFGFLDDQVEAACVAPAGQQAVGVGHAGR